MKQNRFTLRGYELFLHESKSSHTIDFKIGSLVARLASVIVSVINLVVPVSAYSDWVRQLA